MNKNHIFRNGFVLSILALISIMTVAPVVIAPAPISNVEWMAEDTTTGGDWYFNPVGSPIGKYGSYAHILPNCPANQLQIPIGNFSVPISGNFSEPPYNWTASQVAGLPFNKSDPQYWDEYVTQTPPVTYFINGTMMYLDSPYVQYPAFEWAWDDWHTSQTDHREVYYTTYIDGTGGGPGWRLCAWDDGGERCQPVYGYINVTLTFPQGTYLLSLYAYDKEQDQRFSQSYYIYDSTGTLIASKTISGSAFDNGVYEIFKVMAPEGGLTIVVQVYNEAGHAADLTPDSSINVLLSGIFVDELPVVGGFIVPTNYAGLISPLIVALILLVIFAVIIKRNYQILMPKN